MLQAPPRRRPALLRSLPWFAPSLIAVFLAIGIPGGWERYSLLLLLIAASLSMCAVCHAIGFGCEPVFWRNALQRGSAHLLAVAIYTAVVFVLVAWPLAALSEAPSLGATLALCSALALTLVVLWRLWPVFGLLFAWDDAFPSGKQHSGITTALARSATFARHLTGSREMFLTHFLPAALAQLAIACCALSLTGMGTGLPNELRVTALFLFAVVVLPGCSLIVADRTVRLLVEQGDPRFPSALDRSPDRHPSGPASDGDSSPTQDADSAPLGPTPLAPGMLDENLLAALRSGDVRAALDWLDQGASPQATPPAATLDQRSALVLAAELPDTHALRALIGRGADVNRAHAGLTPLLAATRACHDGRPATVTNLLTNGADPACTDSDGNTPLHHAALCAEPTVAAILLDARAPTEARNRDQATPAAVAAGAANWPVLEFLVEHGAQADAALTAAAAITDDDPTGVRLLLQHRAHVNAPDAADRTALLHAVSAHHGAIARVLLDAGADVALADRHGTTPLMEAARAGATELLNLLAATDPDVHATDQHGRTALILACGSPHVNGDCLRTLLALGADPHRPGPDGRNAIDHASNVGRWDLVALLDPTVQLPAGHALEYPADANADTPAHLLDALRFGHWTIVARFGTSAKSWPQSKLAALYLELADHPDPVARSWLLDHGLASEACLDDGRRLFDAALERLPGSAAAVSQLLDAGTTPAGATLFAGALARLGTADDGQALALAMLERGADAFGADSDGRTPLHAASRLALQPLLAALLARGADPNARDHLGATPLHAAVVGDPQQVLPLVKSLIAHGADPESAAASGETPLGLALAGNATELEYWLRWNGWTLPKRPLRAADLPAAATDPDAVARLLELGLSADGRDTHGATALLRASGAGSLRTVEHLLAAHADPRLTANTGASPLSAAVSARHPDIARALVAAGVPTDYRHAGGVTALMIAAALGYPDMVATLRELGARLEPTDAGGRTALHAAARFCFNSRDSLRCRRLLDALLDGNPAPDAADQRGATPLLVLLGVDAKPGAACDGTHLGALLPVLMDAGAAIEHADQHGVTALHVCAMHALIEPARALLARGADREQRDCMHRSPAELARALGYMDLALELAPRGSGVSDDAQIVTPRLVHPEPTL